MLLIENREFILALTWYKENFDKMMESPIDETLSLHEEIHVAASILLELILPLLPEHIFCGYDCDMAYEAEEEAYNYKPGLSWMPLIADLGFHFNLIFEESNEISPVSLFRTYDILGNTYSDFISYTEFGNDNFQGIPKDIARIHPTEMQVEI